MAYELCTLFDRNYLPRGLVLARSLEQVGADFRLRVFAMDDVVPRILESLAVPGVDVVTLAELESLDPALAAVKASRSAVEYMWTATPAICRASLTREPSLSEITYVDADLMFHADPRPIRDESGESSVTIVPHRYAPRWRFYEATNGVYNVEWLTFRRTDEGLAALDWWRQRCLEWCYARAEDGKFGDQKYLDDWPERFEGVHVLEHVGCGLAPWNVDNYILRRDAASGDVFVDDVPLVFHHYHGARLLRRGSRLERLGSSLRLYEPVPGREATLAWHPGYPLPATSRTMLWRPYMEQLARACDDIRAVDSSFEAGVGEPRLRDFAFSARTRLRSLAGRAPRRGGAG